MRLGHLLGQILPIVQNASAASMAVILIYLAVTNPRLFKKIK